jgi:serine phosphatase RsbU (regulator of sigma subunit)
MADLGGLRLSELASLGTAMRAAGAGAGCLEVAAQRVVHHLYDGLRTDGRRDCVLVRFYKTHAYAALNSELRAFARCQLGDEEPPASTPVLVLVATAGDQPAWNDRRESVGHQAVPLPSEHVIESFPMIAQLIRQLGIPMDALVDPDPDLLVELEEKTYGVFYVPVADGSPHVPAQDFVADHGVRSALGFGGILPTGDLFSVVLFSRVAVPPQTAHLFRVLALSVKLAVLPYSEGPLLLSDPPLVVSTSPTRSHLNAVQQLLEVHERTVQEQSARLEELHALEQRRSQQLHALAEVSVLTGSMLSVPDILDHVTARAREIVGAHQAVAGLTVGDSWAQAITSVSLSERYAQYRDDDAVPDGSGIDALVCETNTALRLTQAELEEHPRWRGFGASSPEHPPMNGWLAVPMVSRTGKNLGLVQLSDAVAGDFTAEDEAVLVQLARLASVSIDNARSHARERDVAVALQQSLLPQVQQVEGLVISSAYLPAATDLGVGGDWYDVFELPHGLVALVVGDVVGHDVRASRTMGQLRHAIRAFASEDPAPVCVLSRLDVFLDGSSPDEFATVLYLLVDSATGLVSVANAGHPPPLLLEPGELPRLFDPATAPPVGFLAPSAYQQQDFVLPVGGTLLVYTDGLVERRGAALDDGLDWLVGTAGESVLDPERLLAGLTAQLSAADLDDDVAMLAVRWTGPSSDTDELRRSLSRSASRHRR